MIEMRRTAKPAADVRLDAALVRALLSEQFPELAQHELTFADEGWDNMIFRLGTDLAVRLPRRESAHALLLNEVRWLPFLAPRLPLNVPAPVHRGKPGQHYPYHWAVVPWFDGVSAATMRPEHRDGYAAELAGFFRALHVPAPADAPKNPVRGVPLRHRDEAVRERLAGVGQMNRARLVEIWERGLAEVEHSGPRLWLHGDPHPHTVLASGGKLRAVIDFGDITAGDPASDLAVAWLHFSATGRAEFIGRLATVALYSPGTWVRARAWAVNYAVLMWGLAPEDALHAVGVHGIEQLLAED